MRRNSRKPYNLPITQGAQLDEHNASFVFLFWIPRPWECCSIAHPIHSPPSLSPTSNWRFDFKIRMLYRNKCEVLFHCLGFSWVARVQLVTFSSCLLQL